MTTLARGLTVLLLPFFLMLTNAWLVMSPAFIRWEYDKATFPPALNIYPDDRYRLAVAGLDLITGRMSEADYRALQLRNQPAFTDREVSHMVDVRVVVRNLWLFYLLAGALVVVSLLVLRGRRAARALQWGSLFTIVLLALLGVFAATSFDAFFTRFHGLFFTGDSWIFNATDTLIQVYPEVFWFDAALLIVAATIGEALLIAAVAAWALRAPRRKASAYRVRTR